VANKKVMFQFMKNTRFLLFFSFLFFFDKKLHFRNEKDEKDLFYSCIIIM